MRNNKAMPEKAVRKPDTAKNGKNVKCHSDVGKVEIIIRKNPYWAIFVTPDKANDEYIENYKKRMGLLSNSNVRGTALRTHQVQQILTDDALKETMHMTLEACAEKFNVAVDTVRRYRNELKKKENE